MPAGREENRRWLLPLFLMLCLMVLAWPSASDAAQNQNQKRHRAGAEAGDQAFGPKARKAIEQQFPGVDRIEPAESDLTVKALKQGDDIVGYAYETVDILDIPAYSGKPINILVMLKPDASIAGTTVLEHHEPILLVGIPEKRLFQFADQYIGLAADQRVVVGSSDNPKTKAVDGISGATVTVMVVNESLMRSAHKVAASLGLVEEAHGSRAPPAEVRKDYFQEASWKDLTGNGAIRRLHLTHGDVDEAFQGTKAEGVDVAESPEERQETFVDLYVTYLNPPTVGRNLLGQKEYDWLMGELKPGEHAIALMGNGYSFKGSGYVRGGIFDRIQVRQYGDTISFRDLDYNRLSDVYAAGMPDFREMGIFIIRDHYGFDPGAPWELEFLIRRQTGPVDSVFTSFSVPYQVPDAYVNRPEPQVQETALEDQPMWVQVWYQRDFQITVLGIGIAVLLFILFFQDWLVRYPRMLHNIRIGFLLYTVLFIGWYAMGQLSIVNVLTFVHAVFGGFSWSTFLIDPILFVVWSTAAVVILLWGRAVYCGWLCPFGALQELLNEASRKLKIKQIELPWAVHERLWAIKYLVLLGLFGVSLESMAAAEQLAEVEPFKTAITLKFDRSWPFVTYAAVLLFINLFNRKFFCRYMCPLGAALTIPTRFRIFDWLKRRKECGNPCQVCANECEIQAIYPDGTINPTECHYCLDCQMTYFNDDKCPPLIVKKRKRNKGTQAPPTAREIPVRQLDT
ncbi:4Fe-4S binding protein [Marinobacteraceae bacterium S3BR75-40.1]